ncbi:hypothetical protein K1T71_004412 [Dendrolimus kikuchii]|uniref:Uncharacterized protein n=1 Tax=Dendrolimus kikuchii TaxID=765133 RepID=A0ACC1D827_9NEOP|nr:hypothetical protein K1T71_004412 [Dendrolimus kikuchii]
MERHKLFNRRQNLEETIDEYATDLKNIGRQCNFNTLEDDLIRDIFSWNLHPKNQYIKEKILIQKPETLDQAVQLAKQMETTRQQAKTLEESSFIGQVRSISNHNRQRQLTRTSQGINQSSRSRQSSSSRQQSSHQVGKKCGRCMQVHRYKCPAIGVKCKNCGKYNHFAIACKNKNVNLVETECHTSNTNPDNKLYMLGSIHVNNVNKESWQVNLIINSHNVTFLLDTGADTNLLNLKTFHKLGFPLDTITKSIHKLSSYSGEIIPTVGQCTLLVNNDSRNYNIDFHIVDLNTPNVLGRDSCKELNLIKRLYKVNFVPTHTCKEILDSYNDLFIGLGCLKDFRCELKLKPDCKPSIDACRRIPFQLKNRLKKELDYLEKDGIICHVEEPTEWVSSLVLTTKKDGSLRLCIDPRKLNQAILRSHYQFPTIDEIKSDLAGAKYFSTLDANKGYWMLSLTEATSKLCTFITPFGRYRFTRLPFGINAAPEIFHREMVKQFSDINNVKIMMDDFLIYGKTLQEHNQSLQKVLDRARELNIKFNKEKSSICCTEVKYLGHIFSQEGVKVDPSKVKAICEMPTPTCINELQRFMGMVNYLSPFIPNLSNENSLLRSLLSKNNTWIWSEQHDAEFNKIKSLITNTPVLAYYDPDKNITLSVDASKDAMGAVLLHEKQPIAYASASLTKCQQNYAQIEKEMLSILFGCMKFHQYVYGRKITVETDHKPLITMFKKALQDTPPRLQRIMLRLQPYDLNVIYKSGKYLYIADTLSRAPLPDNTLLDLDSDIDLHINLIMSDLTISQGKLQELQESITNDSMLSKIVYYCQNGWPEHKKSVNQSIKPYFSLKDKLHVLNNILLMCDKIVIPESMREYILKLVHEGHQGINSSIRLAKSTVFWPQMNNDIEKYINQCHICLTYRRNNSKQPIIHHNYKLLPWNKVGIDLFDFDGKKYLIVVDYFSKYVELALLNNSSNAISVITQLKSIFSRHGIPEIMITDNGPPFNSKDFEMFAKDWNIKLIKSSPYLSRSNGMIERTIGTVKHILNKCKADNTDSYIALLMYRNTPKQSGYSPSQLCMSRCLRTKIPVTDTQLTPSLVDMTKLTNNIEKQKRYSTLYYNKNTKSLSDLQVGDNIYFKHKPQGSWVPGRITQVGNEPRSYIIQSPEGTFRRNREHIIKPVTSVTDSVAPEKETNVSQLPKTTRSGRIIKPPKYFYDNVN